MPSTIISSLGLLWREDHVFWGAGKQSGSLLGVPATNVTAPAIDFRDQVGIYVLYSDYKVIYVGQSGSGNQKLFKRLRQHRKDDLAGRWDRFSWFGTRRVIHGKRLSGKGERFRPTRYTVLDHIEGILIHACEPPLNGQGGRFGKNVKRYLQVRDERLGPTTHELLEVISRSDVVGINPKKLQLIGRKWKLPNQ